MSLPKHKTLESSSNIETSQYKFKMFEKLLQDEAKAYSLKDCNVVIDGWRFFDHLYAKSGLPFAFGCECDRFANFLTEYLDMFKKANVKCYTIFIGRSEFYSSSNAKNYVPAGDVYVKPILAKDVYQQVLDKMGINYVFCLSDSKQECIAMAQALNCPVISNDKKIEICYANVQFIPMKGMHLNESKNTIECCVVDLNDFICKYRLTTDKLSLLMALSDEPCTHDFSLHEFLNFIKVLRNTSLPNGIISLINRPLDDGRLFLKHFNLNRQVVRNADKMKASIGRKEKGGVPTYYLQNGNRIQIVENDRLWFEKGVACGHIAIPYIYLYKLGILMGSSAIEDTEAESESILLSLDIVKYAYDLLTNYKKTKFEVRRLNAENITVYTEHDVSTKPNYEAKVVVFENGWDQIRDLGLFEHFLKEHLRGFNFQCLEQLPEDMRLLMIALVYFSAKKSNDVCNEVYSVLLSYVILGVTFEKNQNVALAADCRLASDILHKYFEMDEEELKETFDRQIIHPLVEFQYCLLHLNYLNTLCGSPYKKTFFHKAYNGTFVYKILYTILKHYDGDGMYFLAETLQPAATVLDFLQTLAEEYHQLLLLI